MVGRFEGRVAIVTGAGAGVGKVTAQRFAAEGASVVAADIRTDAAHAVVEGIRAQGGQALAAGVATMYGREGIRCVAVAPGLIMSDTSRAALSEAQLRVFSAERILPWAAEPEDIAAVVTWLASDEARCITGQTIVVDSGTTAHRPQHAMKQWDSLRA